MGPTQIIIGSDSHGKSVGKMLRKYGVQMLTTAGGNLIVGPLLPAKTVLPTPRADPQITVDTEEEAVTLYGNATKECLNANMPLHSWISN